MDDIAARIAITVEAGKAIRDLDNLRSKLDEVTAAREKDLRVSTEAGKKMAVVNRQRDTGGGASSPRLSKAAIKEEIAASTRALQKQREELSAVNKIIEERGAKSVEELKIEQAAARQVTAEYRQQRAELALLRAEQKYNIANKNLALAKLNKDDPRRIVALSNAAEEYKRQWTAAQQVAADAAISAKNAAIAYDGLINPVTKVGDATKKTTKSLKGLTAQQIIARSASRALRMDLGEGTSPAMFKLGIIAAGAASAVKVLATILNRMNEDNMYDTELSNRNLQSTLEATKRIQEHISEQKSLVDSIDELQQKERLSNVEKYKMSKLLNQLSGDYAKLGISIDGATGKLKGWDEAFVKMRKEQLQWEISRLERDRREIQANRKEQASIISGEKNIAVQAVDAISNIYNSPLANSFIGKYSPARFAFKAAEKLGAVNYVRGLAGGFVTSMDAAKIEEANKKYDELVNQEQEKSREISLLNKQLSTIDKNRADEQAAQKKDLEEQIKQEQKNILADLVSERFRLRETAQSATFANTLEAARLQSRIMLGASGINLNDNPQKVTAEQSKKQVALLEDLCTGKNTIIDLLSGFVTATV